METAHAQLRDIAVCTHLLLVVDILTVRKEHFDEFSKLNIA